MKYKITSRFKEFESFRSRPHNGIDFKMKIGEPLRSVEEGVVRLKDFGDKNAGKTVIIDTNDGKSFVYGHLSRFSVKEGEIVEKGELIGYSGNTGNVIGNGHLHFGVKENGHFIDPSPWVDSIQNMDKLRAIAEKATAPDNIFTIRNIFNQQNSVHLDLLKLFKANFIPFLTEIKLSVVSFVTNHTIFNQYFEHLIQFFF